jgi:hypothetical protein
MFKERKRRLFKNIFFVMSFIIIFGSFLFEIHYLNKYYLGVLLVALIQLFFFCLAIAYLNIKLNKYKPKNDPGIVIWWFFCLRIGYS